MTGGGAGARDVSAELVREARAQGIELWTEGRRLRYRSPHGDVPSELKAGLAAARDAVAAWLRAEGAGRRDLEELASNQLGMWYQQRLAPKSGAFNLGFAVRILGGLASDALLEALQVVVDRHEVLRTDYPEVNGSPRRRVVGACDARLLDEGTLAEGASLPALLRGLVRMPFPLEGDPLFRAHLLRHPDGDDVLLVVGHHLTLDGLSILLVCKEIVEVYGAVVRGEAPPASGARPTAYTEYVTSQQAWLAGPGRRSAEYWRRVLDPPPPILNLPLDRTRPRVRPLAGETVSEPCAPGIATRIRNLARARGTTPFVVLLSAYTALLRRLTGQTDIVVGAPVHGRGSGAHTRTIGHLMNVVPIRTDAPPDVTFAQLVESVHRTFHASTPHQEYPFPLMAWGLAKGGRPDLAVQALFALPELQSFSELRGATPDGGASAVEEAAGVRAQHVRFDQLEGQLDLSLEVFAAPDDTFLCAWRYATDVLDDATVRSWAGVFSTLLSGLVEDQDRPIASIPLLASSDPDPAVRGPGLETGAPLLDRIRAHARRVGDRPAVASATGSYTYAELVAAADSVAAALRAHGVGPGDHVGVAVRRGRELPAALLGTLAAGAAYVPLDPTHPEERLRYVMEDSGAVALVTQDGFQNRVGSAAAVIDLDHIGPAAPEAPAAVDPRSAAYVIYTSGSTGRPKGVVVSHASMQNFLESMLSEPGFAPSDTLVSVTTPSFDISVLELYLPLLAGGRLVVASEDQASDGEALAALIDSAEATVMQATPATWKLLRSAGWSGRRALRVLCGGETLSRALADELLERVGELWNMYGPTEATVWSTLARVEPEGPVLIGRPIANTVLHVLDEDMRPLPVGVPGELHIGGAGVAIGYWNRPVLTAERFGDDPFRPGTRLYRTGDLVRRRDDGRLEHLGRLDQQVKVRGFRIELGEIEATLSAHPDVEAAMVTADATPDDPARLIAWIEPRRGGTAVPSVLRGFLEEHLPAYMMPAGWAVVDYLPRTPNGKLDRRALHDRLRFEKRRSAADAPRTTVAPRNAEETLLAEIWGEVLGVDELGVHDDFFQLGGNSLLATMVTARVRSVFDVELPLRHLFERPTIAATAERLRGRRGTGGGTGTAPRSRDDGGPAPLSFSQERMWFLQELVPEDTSYNLSLATVVRGPFDRGRLIAAVTEVERRHTVLRSRIRTDRGRATQVVTEPGGFEIVEDAFTPSTPGRVPERAIDFVAAVMNRSYRLAEDAPMRIALARLGEEEHLLGIGLHHVVADQVSFELLLREVVELYERADHADLPDLPVQYADFSVWQRGQFRDERLGPDLSYWMERLDGVAPLEVATDRPRPNLQTPAGDRVLLDIPPDTVRGIQELSLEMGVTPFMLLLAVFNALLYARSRQTDIAVGVPIAHRSHRELENLIGTFVNTLVHRNDLSGDPSFRELVARVRDTALQAFTHQEAPFELLVRELKPARDTSRSPLFQAMFNLATDRMGEMRVRGVETEPVVLPSPAAQFDLTMGVLLGDRLQLYALSYRTDLFERATAESLLRQYGEIVERVVADPDVCLDHLTSAARGERWLTLDEWNRTRVDWNDDRTLLALLVQRAERDGERTAVTSRRGDLSYAELTAAAAVVAAELRRRGVRRGDRVGVMLRRGRELLPGLLGVLGSGAAYVPMDPEYPAERLRYMLEDSGAVALVTDAGLHAELGVDVPLVDVRELGDARGDAPGLGSASTTSNGRPSLATPDDEDTAYVIYTSGSTGRPKGVAVPHGAMMNFLRSMEREPGLSETDTVLAVTTPSFDISVLELFLPLWVGGRVVIADEADSIDGRRLAELIDGERVTVMQATPATWKLMLSGGWKGRRDLRMLCGGEPLSPELANQLAERGAAVWNMYGPTETTVWSTIHRVHPGEPIRIGRPIANTTAYVLDETMRPLPIGVPGELFIGGAGVSSGYLHRPELTAERFVESPFREGERLYRTGDRVRYRHDGTLEHLGRLDHQVKVRGFRIEPGEIESTLRDHDDVDDAAVLARDDRLVAYVVPSGKERAESTDLRRWLGERLPRHLVPSRVMILDALPRTPNGKLDRALLPDLLDGTDVERDATPLAGRAEELIGEVWSGLLGVERVGAADNFFELGGHSLLAMEAVAHLEERTGVRIEPRELFFKTVRQLGKALSAAV